MDTDRLQYRIDKINRTLDGLIEVASQYGNSTMDALIAQIRIELEYLENQLQLLEDY